MLEIKKLKSLHVAQISLLISTIIYQKVYCKYFNISLHFKIYKQNSHRRPEFTDLIANGNIY